MMIIETERLTIRPFHPGDISLIQRIYGDEELLRYTPFDIMSKADAERQLENCIRDWGQPPGYNHEMIAILKEKEDSIGRTHIEIDQETDTGMIGWFILPEHSGRGYATEITRALIRHCFEEFKLHRVNAVCNPENKQSWHVLEKCGMRREAYLRKKCRYVKNGVVSFEDELEYAILKEEWHESILKS